jgi:uncharacterized protein with HEPN domain
MQRDLCGYLWDVVRAIDDITSFTSALSFEQYLQNRLVQAAVERKLEIVGEALKEAIKFYPDVRASISNISNVIGLRDRLAHGYLTLDQEILWNIIEVDLPILVATVKKLAAAQCK